MQIHIIKDIAQRRAVVQQEETRLINGIKKIKKIKRKRVLEEKRCRYCYELFIPTCQQQIFCCDKCRREEYKKRFPARKELQRIEVKDNKKSEKTLADINKIAKSKGLTYGQYMILLQTEKDRKERAKIS